MKTLQNNYTTPEQSKRLLELGVPADSADMYYCRMRTKEFGLPYLIGCDATYTSISTPPCGFIFAPCWSVGRLIEILLLCHPSNEASVMFDNPLYDVSNCTNIEWCIRVLESSLQCGRMDFSKLEEWI